jgi:repressor LexA
MSPVTLYKRQKEILEFIVKYIEENNYSPTLQEIATAMGLSSLATVHEHINALERKGLLTRYDGSVRGLKVNSQNSESETLSGIVLPVVGYIAAGRPIDAIQNESKTISVSPDLVPSFKKCFVLQVRGDSMIDEGIFNGDYVVIQSQDTAENGDIIVALLENGFATLKSFYREKGGVIRLQPANPKMEPIYTNEDELIIQGKVTGVIRKYT